MQLIISSKPIGKLYHFISPDHLAMAMISGVMRPFWGGCSQPMDIKKKYIRQPPKHYKSDRKESLFYGVSTTRNPNWQPKEYLRGSETSSLYWDVIRLTLDGDKIGTKYPVKSYNDFWKSEKYSQLKRTSKDEFYAQSEEKIITDENGFKDWFKYLLAVDVLEEVKDEFDALDLDFKNVPVSFVRDFSRQQIADKYTIKNDKNSINAGISDYNRLITVLKKIVISSKKTDIENLQPDTVISVFHGTCYEDAYNMVLNGIDAKKQHYRKYPHFSGGKQVKTGLYIAPDLKTAQQFGQTVLKFKAQGKDLYPTFPAEMKKDDKDLKKYYPNSFRPSVSFTLLSKGIEPQALFRGFVSPRAIEKIYVYEYSDSSWNEMSKEKFLEHYEPKQAHKHVVEPQEKIPLKEFYERIVKNGGGSLEDIQKIVKHYLGRETRDADKINAFIEIFHSFAPETVLKRLAKLAVREISSEQI